MRYLYFLLFIFNFSHSQSDIFNIARKGTVEELKKLIEENKSLVNTPNNAGFSPLIIATYSSNLHVAKYLLNIAEDINYQSPEGTVLMAAIMRNNIEMVNLLLDKEANIEITNDNGVTPLMLAIQFKNIEIIKLLLKNNANKAAIDKEGKTTFEYAVATKEETIIQLFKN
jgi:ankyrin repeat protein